MARTKLTEEELIQALDQIRELPQSKKITITGYGTLYGIAGELLKYITSKE